MESGDLQSSDSGFDGDSWQLGRPAFAEAWVSPGRPELSERMLFAFIEPPVQMLEVSALIRNALSYVRPLLPVDLLPSSRGAMLLRCANFSDRESLHRLSPLTFDGHVLYFERPEETSDRFFRIPTWLAFVAVVDFPIEHWYDGKIQECFSSFCNVVEVDPESLSGENFGPLRLLLEINDRLDLPRELRISSARGVGRFGAVAKIMPIRVWPRELQLDGRGNLASFFGPPAPPSPGPNLGPIGPLSGQRQLRPSPHHLNAMYHPQRTAAFPARHLAFDPLCAATLAVGAPPTAGAPHTSALLQAGRTSSQVLGLALLLARLLLLPASAPAAEIHANSSPSSPILSLVDSPVAANSPERVLSTPVITYSRRRSRPGVKVPAVRRSSSRLAAKAPAKFVDMTTQAVQRKALLNSLSTCSKALKKHVSSKNILSCNHLPIGAADLRKLVSAAKLDCKNVDVDGPAP